MNYQHKKLAEGSWNKLTLIEQLANIGSEVERTINWKNKNNLDYSRLAFRRALELIDLTLADSKNFQRLKEIARLREILVDYFLYKNTYCSSDQSWHNYFYAYAYVAALNRK